MLSASSRRTRSVSNRAFATYGLLFLAAVVHAQTISGLQQLLLQTNQIFAGDQPVSSVSMTGQADWNTGTTQNSGRIMLKASTDGSSSMELQAGSITRTETENSFVTGQTCSWSGNDNVMHDAPMHNCAMPLAWFFPELAFFSTQLPSTGNLVLSSSGTAVHWSPIPPTGLSADLTYLLKHIGEFDLEFDSSSFLPVKLSYSVHPDTDAGTNIPASIEYSDYHTINGVAVPFHIRRYLNGTLLADITLTDAVVTR